MVNETINQTVNSTIANNYNIFGIPTIDVVVPVAGSAAIDIYIITLFVSLLTLMLKKYLTDQVKIKAIRKETKAMQKKVRETMEKDPKKAQKLQKEMMKTQMENFKFMFDPKVMLVTILPVFLVFSQVAGLYGPLGEFFNVFGLTTFGWLGTYITFSIINSMILSKVLDIA